MSILVISFDAVGDKVFEAMAKDSGKYPNIARFKKDAFYKGAVKTVFVTNTYPIHTTVSTGALPKEHGIISNFLPPKKNGERPWAQMAKHIKGKTIWQAAREKKLSTAAFLWPVTCGAKIDYHIPEVHIEKGQNLLFRSLLYGSVFFQIASIFRHGKKLIKAIKGMEYGGQPELDDFTVSAACDLFKQKKCDLALVHLIAYDSLYHFKGSGTEDLDIAKKSLDTNLGRLLDCWSGSVIIFSDHSQLDVNQNINLQEIYGNAVFEQAGGSAFFYSAPDSRSPALKEQPWFERYLSKKEMEESGYSVKSTFGIAAKTGYIFTDSNKYKGAHGYPADYENYNVFYCVKGSSHGGPSQRQAAYEQVRLKNHITDVTKIIIKELNLDMPDVHDII